MSKISRRSLLKAGAAGSALLPASHWRLATAQTLSPVRIGAVIPLSGPAAPFGNAAREGAQIAVDLINNSGGVLGRRLELVVRDSKGNPAQVGTAARELLGDGIRLFMSGVYGFEALTITPLVAAEGGIVFSVSTVLDALTHESFDPRFFRINAHNFYIARVQAKLAAERLPDVTWGGILSDFAASRTWWAYFTASLKEFYPQIAKKEPKIVEPLYVKVGATDFKPQISAFMGSGADAMLSSVSGEDFSSMVTQMRAFNLNRELKAYLDSGQEMTAAKTANRNLPDNFWTFSAWYYAAHQDNPMSVALVKEYVARTKDPYPNQTVFLGHSIVNAYAQAMNATKSGNPDDLAKWLAGGSIDTARGKIFIRKEDHQGLIDLDIMRIGPADTDPGWVVHENFTMAAKDIIEPPSPGQKIVFP